MRTRTAIFNGTLAVLVVGTGTYGASRLGTKGSAASTGIVYTVKKTNVLSSVSATGNVESTASYNVNFASAGTVTEIDAKIGDKVSAGQVLARTDDSVTKTALANAQANLASAQSALAALQAGLTPAQVAQLTLSVQQAQQAIQAAQAGVEAANGQAASDAKASALAIGQAQTAQANTQAQTALSLSNAQTAVNNAQAQLNTDSSVANPDANKVAADQTALTNAQNQLASVKIQNSTSLTNAQNQVDNAAQSQANTQNKDAQAIASAQRQLASAQSSYQGTLLSNQIKQAPPTQAQLDQANAQIQSATAAVASAQKAEDQTALVAPISGVVSAVNGQLHQPSSVLVSSSGGSAGSGAGFMTITDMDHLRVTAGFSETDAAKIRVGMAATLSFDALGGQTFTGKVVLVSPTSTTVNNVITYSVQTALDAANAQVKPGMTANVSIVVQETDGVLAVPSAALSGVGTTATALVKSSKGTVSTRVQVGLRGDNAVEITSGLTDGQQVVAPAASASSSSIQFGAGRIGAAIASGGGVAVRAGG